MNPQTLERIGVAYRRGYYDGYEGKEQFLEVRPGFIKPFAEFDYAEGYKAGANDAKWEKFYAARQANLRVEASR